jgi:HD-GYP domain-containing protein (c-di-GMP phosphodiesterase class II)
VSDEEALRILEERKGTTYDPAIVEAFMADYESLSRTKVSGDSHARALFEIARSSRETAKEPQMRPQTTGATSGESTK